MNVAANVAQAPGSALPARLSAGASRAVAGASLETSVGDARKPDATPKELMTLKEQFGEPPNWAREAPALRRAGSALPRSGNEHAT